MRREKESKLLIYSKIRSLAKERSTSISAIERNANLASGSICKWDSVSPTIKNLLKVAKILNVKVEELIKEGE